jgi:hypothetical protein
LSPVVFTLTKDYFARQKQRTDAAEAS